MSFPINMTRGEAGQALRMTLMISVLTMVLFSAGSGLAGVGLADGGNVHGGLALAQSEEDGRSGGATVGVDEDTGDSDEGNESAESNESDDADAEDGEESENTTPMEERAGSQTADDPAEADGEDENATPMEERADSEVPEGANDGEGSDGISNINDEDDDGIGYVAQRMLDMIEGLTTQASNEFGGLVSQMLELAVSRSAPGVADAPDTWSSPESPEWRGAMDMMELTRFMGIIITIVGGLYSVAMYASQPRSSKRRLKWCAISSIFLLKPAFWIGGSLHLSNTLSTTIAPGPEAFAAPEGILLVGLSVIAAGILAGASIWIIALAAFVTVIAHNAGLVTAGFLPLAIALYVGPIYLRSLSEMIVYLHGVTITMPIFQAISVLGVSRMFLTEGGVLSTLSGVLMFLGVVYLVFYLFQKEVLEKAFDAPITHLGVHGAQLGAEGARNTATTISNAPQMYRDVRQSIEMNIETARSTIAGSDGGFSHPSVGAVQGQDSSAPSSSSLSRSAVADGGSDASESWGVDAKSSPFPPGPDDKFQSVGRSNSSSGSSTSVSENRERDRLSHGDY